jgi:hypothetical protein
MLAGAPNLHRAVAECTQPYSAPSASAARALQVRWRRMPQRPWAAPWAPHPKAPLRHLARASGPKSSKQRER